MKQSLIFLLATTLFLSSCGSYRAWDRAATGSLIGGAFGAIVGAAIGGRDGADTGQLIGTVAGAAIGAASGAEEDRRRAENLRLQSVEAQNHYYHTRPYSEVEPINYSRLQSSDFMADYDLPLDVSRLTFSDGNGDRMLSPGERAQLSFDIHNAGKHPARNVSPIVSCNYKRIDISPSATIATIQPGETVRYRVNILPRRNARTRSVTFEVAFPDGQGRAVLAKTFTVRIID